MSNDRRRFAINNSTAKQQFAFSKDERFKAPKIASNAFGYESKSQFGHHQGSGNGRAFGTSQDRFGYENVRFSKQSGKIDGPGSLDRKSNAFAKTFSFSFGVSRSAMKKIHVDEILRKKEENLPGPGNYQLNTLIGKEDSVKYTMRAKASDADYSLKKAKQLPGPGYYQDPSLTGVKPVNSKMLSTSQFAFSRDDRFKPLK